MRERGGAWLVLAGARSSGSEGLVSGMTAEGDARVVRDRK